MVPNQIEKTTLLKAPLAKVWRAIAEPDRFGAWFGARIAGEFVPGTTLQCVLAPTEVDEEVAAKQREWDGTPFELIVVEVVPEKRLSFRWYPCEFEAGVDLATQPTTLVTFELEERAEGVFLRITESGFDAVPPEQRAKAFEANDGGWAMQAKLIETYLATRG